MRPVILFGTKYWSGMVKWIEEIMLGVEGNINAVDMSFLTMTDDPKAAVKHMNDFFKSHPLRPNF